MPREAGKIENRVLVCWQIVKAEVLVVDRDLLRISIKNARIRAANVSASDIFVILCIGLGFALS